MAGYTDATPSREEIFGDATYKLTPELRKLFEVDSIEKGEPAETLGGFSYIVSRLQVLDSWGDEMDEETAKATAVSYALNRFKEASHIITTRWGNIFEDRNARTIALAEFGPERMKMLDSLQDSTNSLYDSFTSPTALLANIISLTITLSTGNKGAFEFASRTYESGISPIFDHEPIEEPITPVDEQTDYYADLFDRSYKTIYRAGTLQPSRVKRDVRRLYEKVNSGQFDTLIEASQIDESPSTDTLDFIRQNIDQELTFSVLSPDSNLGEIAEGIYRESTDSEKTYVDPKRVEILAQVRELVGKEHCYFARGKRTGRTHADDSGQRIDEDYIVLVMQHHGPQGEVLGEDALAISPIARKHAAYLTRHDTSHGLTWRELFQLTKSEAQELGTRRLKFTTVQGEDIVDTMQEKVLSLLTCQPEDFTGDLRRSMNGYKLVQRRALGGAALREPYESYDS